MLNSLLDLSGKDRKKLLTTLSLATKEYIFDGIYTLTEELELDKIEDFETRVKMRAETIAKFPDEVFWDYAECANSALGRRIWSVPEFERLTNVKISTNGDVVVFNRQKVMFIHSPEPKDRYDRVGYNKGLKTIHRIVASTFIPKPGRLKHIEYKYLQVNHMDYTQWNNKLTNLEWVTEKENSRHRYELDGYNKEQYFRFTCQVDNGFLGQEFVLPVDDVSLFNTTFGLIRKFGTFKGFTVCLINHEDIGDTPVGFPNDMKELFNRNPLYFDIRVIPLIGTVLRGKYKGLKFSLFGRTEISQYFDGGGTQSVLKGRTLSHRGCHFTYATHKEAIPLHGKMTNEIVRDARQS